MVSEKQTPNGSRFNRKKEALLAHIIAKYRGSTPKQRRTIFICIVIGLIAVLLSFYLYGEVASKDNTGDNGSATSNVCGNNSELLNRVNDAKNSNNTDALKALKNEIKSKQGYEYDQNCLYGLIIYALYNGDAKEARHSYNKYKAIYNNDDNKYLTLGFKSIESVEKLGQGVANLEETTKVMEDNVRVFTPPNIPKQ